MYLIMHNHLPKILLRISKNHRFKIKIFKLFAQGLQSVELFHQLTET